MEGSGLRWRVAILGGGERSQLEGSDRRREQCQVEGSDRCWGRAEGSDVGGGELSLVEGGGLRMWGVIARREEQLLVEGAVSGGGEQSLVEGSGLRWRGADAGGQGKS